jgi:diadenosine tetraphosphate (Ap4A) HIT family hydrolase
VDRFSIAPTILQFSEPLLSLTLCEVRLMNDARWPWLVLVPRRPGAQEIEHLCAADRAQLIEECVAAGGGVRAMGSALGRPVEKLNIGALGNSTPQLHVHVVGRRADDPAWPGPVWGHGQITPYEPLALERAQAEALAILEGWAPKASGPGAVRAIR